MTKLAMYQVSPGRGPRVAGLECQDCALENILRNSH